MATSPQLDMIPAILRKHTLAVGNAPHIRTVWINCARGGEHSNLVFNGGPIKLGENQAVNWAIPLAALVLINHSSLKLYFETQACGTYSEATTKRSHQKHRACSSSRFWSWSSDCKCWWTCCSGDDRQGFTQSQTQNDALFRLPCFAWLKRMRYPLQKLISGSSTQRG